MNIREMIALWGDVNNINLLLLSFCNKTQTAAVHAGIPYRGGEGGGEVHAGIGDRVSRPTECRVSSENKVDS